MGLNQYNTTNGEIKEGMLLKDKSITLYGGNGILFDDDGDTSISATTANKLDVKVNGALDFWFTINMLVADADSAFAGQGGNIVPMIPIAGEERASGSGAASVTAWYTAWTTTSADAGTLADGTQYGQMKKVHLVVDGGDLTLTPDNLDGGTQVVFEDAGDFAIFMWNSSAWVMVESGNTVDGVSSPTLS